MEARRRDERQRRENRGAVGAEGGEEWGGREWGVSPSQPTKGSGERRELPQRGNLVHFVATRRTLIATICLLYVSLTLQLFTLTIVLNVAKSTIM